jgi:Ohr subfamily peroxiredoxin
MAIDKALYTGRTTSTGGRTGSTRSDDGALSAVLVTPRELGGAGGAGTNPEQLFAAGYSACFIGAMKAVAARTRTALPAEPTIDAAVTIGPMTGKAGAFAVDVAMTIAVPGMRRAALEQLVAAAHEVCPYSNATRGNIHVALTLA